MEGMEEMEEMQRQEEAQEAEEDFSQMQGEEQKDLQKDEAGDYNQMMDENDRERKKGELKAKIAKGCIFTCTQIFTLVYGLYHFDVIGATKTDCYYVKGNKLPLSAISASVAAKAQGNGVKPINVSTNFDFVISLGLWNSLFTWVAPIPFMFDNRDWKVKYRLLVMFITVVLQIALFISAIMYRHSEAGAVCAGSYLSKPTTAQSSIIMTSKGLFINIILIMNYVFFGCVTCFLCYGASVTCMTIQRQKKEREMEMQPKTEMEIEMDDARMDDDRMDDARMDDAGMADDRME